MFPKLQFSKKFVTRSVFGELQLMQISLNFKTSCRKLKIRCWEQNSVWFFSYFIFEGNYDVLNSQSACKLLNKTINFTKNGKELAEMENPLHSFRESSSSYRNRKLKVKPWWVEACERKKRGFFVPFSVQKILLRIKEHYLKHFLLAFKIIGSLQCILNLIKKYYSTGECCLPNGILHSPYEGCRIQMWI